MPIPTILHAPLHGIAAHDARTPLLAAIGDVVAVVIGKFAALDLAVIDDAVVVSVGGPFDDV
jgi:hypothetical protein